VLPPGHDVCREDLVSLRRAMVEHGRLMEVARARGALPDEACGLIGNYAQSEMKLIRYVRANAARCEIPSEVTGQLRSSHRTTQFMLQKVCLAAREAASREPVGPVGDFDHLIFRRGDFDLPK
jgi:hypothetical protein